MISKKIHQTWFKSVRTEELASDYSSLFDSHLFSAYLSCSWSYYFDCCIKSSQCVPPDLESFSVQQPYRPKLFNCTTLQHIKLDPFISVFKKLGITDVFWSHAKLNETMVADIRIHPFPLYPTLCFESVDGPYSLQPSIIQNSTRDLLFSFVGAYVPGLYISKVREFIFSLPRREDYLIVCNEGGWHFDDTVYRLQMDGEKLLEGNLQSLRSREVFYRQTLQRSLFSLCPSGSGPNSIRLWESLGFGCIPVVLSDQLRLPGTEQEWDGAIVRLPETEKSVKSLPYILQEVASDPLYVAQMQGKCHELWLKYGLNGPKTIFENFLRPQNLLNLLNVK